MPPPFHADHVGSLLRPRALTLAFRRAASGEIGREQFRGGPLLIILDQVVKRNAVADQEDLTIFIGAQEIGQGHEWIPRSL